MDEPDDPVLPGRQNGGGIKAAGRAGNLRRTADRSWIPYIIYNEAKPGDGGGGRCLVTPPKLISEIL